ncbi:YibE/F family protein [Lactobacillus sp. PV012]|uniref:YibE/F family protein n=1 Tax=Lactobacillus sp. PV012 TaxID=2594494 RepID=UPI00223F6924|nr:YibE/F family protein [Lactobacillus sp. PV012]QNQ81716.1 YibE/F family protein [Lactobacillus sp. PV012]
MQKKYRWSLVIFLVGIIITGIVYFTTAFSSQPIGEIITKPKDSLINKTEDSYQNKDELRQQTFKIRILNGKNKGKVYLVENEYAKSQVITQKYYSHQRVIVAFLKGKAKVLSPKRDWVFCLALTVVVSLMFAIMGKSAKMLLLSLLLNAIIFYYVVKLDIATNGVKVLWIYSLASIIFTFLSLVLAQGFSKKMVVTFVATLLGVFVAFGLSYVIMKLTNESGMKYEAVEYATQDPRTIFLAQSLLGVLGAVMDEATDIVSSLYNLSCHKLNLTLKELVLSGRTLGQEIMGPLINVLVLIFMAEALPMAILYLRDNNTLKYTFEFALSLGIIQSLISAIGIVLTVVFATLCSTVFLREKRA